MGILYLLSYHFAYLSYINPRFEYAYYFYNEERSFLYIFFAYICALFPIFFYKASKNPANFGISLLFVLCYMPAQLTISFMWMSSDSALIGVALALTVSMSIFFLVAGLGYKKNINSIERTNVYLNKKIHNFMFFLGVICFSSFIYENFPHMRLVGFSEVYDLRFEARDSQNSVVFGYFNMWLSVIVTTYFSALSFVCRKYYFFIISVLLSIICYMGTGAKGALLLPFIIYSVGYIYSLSGDFLRKLLLINSFFLIILFSLNFEILDMARSVYGVRMLSTGGWTIATYYDYFSRNGWTYYSHIGIIEWIFKIYPYEDFSLGQLIGVEYSGSSDANFNANFWASDGISAFGILGIYVITFLLIVFIYYFNKIIPKKNSLLYTLWFTGFWMTLFNAPFSVSLLSGGGIVILIIIYLADILNIKKVK